MPEINWPYEISVFLARREAETGPHVMLARQIAYDLISREIDEFVKHERLEKEETGEGYIPFSQRVREGWLYSRAKDNAS